MPNLNEKIYELLKKRLDDSRQAMKEPWKQPTKYQECLIIKIQEYYEKIHAAS